MTNLKRATIAVLIMSGLLIQPGTYVRAQEVDADVCDRPAETHTLRVNETNNVPTGVTLGNDPMDDLYVCPGDTVAWILQGRGFAIDFSGATPFDDNQHRAAAPAGRVSAVVRSDVTRGTSFKYAISLDDGGTLDPRIIVQD